MRITRVEFDRFKALEEFSLSLEHFNVLVGPNNSGKSTAISAFRILRGGIAIANSRSPVQISVDGLDRSGYWLSNDAVPVSLENVHTEYRPSDSHIRFVLSPGRSLTLRFPADGGCCMLIDPSGPQIDSPTRFRRYYGLDLGVVPVLAALDSDEEALDRKYVRSSIPTYRSARHFRNYWYHFPDEFPNFVELVRRTWPGISDIQRPQLTLDGRLFMLCIENGRERELSWAGFGFQIWCQLLTHLSRMREADVLIIDEPEVYLHPELQRRLVGLLQEFGPDVVIATHSSEIVTEVEARDLVIVDKARKIGKRTSGTSAFRLALAALGSNQNVVLSGLARTRRVLFVEGDDFKMIRQLARVLGLAQLAAGVGVTPYPLGGFPNVDALRDLSRGIESAVGEPVAFAGVFDRDYRSDAEIDELELGLRERLCLAHVWYKKELENYILVPAALDRAIAAEAVRRGHSAEVIGSLPTAEEILGEVTAPFRDEVESQYFAARVRRPDDPSLDISTVHREVMTEFARRWARLDVRLGLVPGKRTVSALFELLQERHGVALSKSAVVASLRVADLPFELATSLRQLDTFRGLNPDDQSTWPRD